MAPLCYGNRSLMYLLFIVEDQIFSRMKAFV
jgi:hypothetical protein